MNDCVFCRIAAAEIPAQVVYEDEEMIAFRDADAQAPVHVLVVPKKHIASYLESEPADEAMLGRLARRAALIAEESGVDETGFRIVVNSGADAGQTVLHLHLHVLGGRDMGSPWSVS